MEAADRRADFAEFVGVWNVAEARAFEAKGKPLPINDVWIAAQCLETGAVLVTYDPHFAAVDGVRVWPEPAP